MKIGIKKQTQSWLMKNSKKIQEPILMSKDKKGKRSGKRIGCPNCKSKEGQEL